MISNICTFMHCSTTKGFLEKLSLKKLLVNHEIRSKPFQKITRQVSEFQVTTLTKEDSKA